MAVDFVYLNEQLANMVDRLAPEWFPNGKYQSGSWLIGNIQGDPGKSLSIDMTKEPGRWKDFATDEGGDLVALYAAANNINMIDAARQLCDRYHIGSEIAPVKQRFPLAKKQYKLVMPPDDAPSPALNATSKWPYKDRNGQTMFWVARYDEGEKNENGKKKKKFIPWCWDSNSANWVAKHWPDPRPIYGLDLLAAKPEKPVIVVEGEKAADALRAVSEGRYVAISWSGGCSGHQKTDWAPLAGKSVTIWPDADAPGRRAGENIAGLLHSLGCQIRIVDTDGLEESWDAADAMLEGWDVDKIARWAKERARTYTDITHKPSVPAPATNGIVVENPSSDTIAVSTGYQHLWKELGLYVNSFGKPLANEANVLQVLRAMGSAMPNIWYDTFHRKHMIRDDGKNIALHDSHARALLNMLQEKVGIGNIEEGKVWRAMATIADHRKTNEARDWLRLLKWDGTPRIDSFFSDIASVEPSVYAMAVSKNFWISMVARIMQPGCQVDNMVILEGVQGSGKTSLFRIIAGDWYAEVCQKMFDPREFALILPGKILVEMGELHVFKTADIEQMKQFITITKDSYRAPYERTAQDWPRQCIFIGTTNHAKYLTDPTGARRFWPLASGEIKLDSARECRDQYFAEALERYNKGETWHEVPETETAQAQERRRLGDPWEEVIRNASSKLHENITTQEIAESILDIKPERHDNRMSRRIAACMRVLGWKTDKCNRWTKETNELFEDKF